MADDDDDDAKVRSELHDPAYLPPYIQPLMEGIRRLYGTKEFADVSITCNGKKWRAHRLVLCAQSEYFQKMLSSTFKEAKESKINFDDDDWEMIHELLYCKHERVCHSHDSSLILPYADFYFFKYSDAPPDNVEPIIYDVRVYAVADKYLVGDLREIVADHFTRRAEQVWSTKAFADAIHEIYTKGPQVSLLRDIVVTTVHEHPELLETESVYTRFREVLGEVAEFGRDLALTGYKAMKVTQKLSRYKCPNPNCAQIIEASSETTGCYMECGSCDEPSRPFDWWEDYEILEESQVAATSQAV